MNRHATRWVVYASPPSLYRLAGRLAPWFATSAGLLLAVGVFLGLFVAPTDFQQGDVYRVLFLHVPASWLGMWLYLLLGFYAALGWIFNARSSSMMASALAVTGAMFTGLSLATGSLWGRPAWGTWWVWDARTTSTLILLFLYVGFITLQSAIDDPRRADRAGAVIAVVGVVNVPIIYFSVQWWNTLHQGATIRVAGETTMPGSMLTPMLIMVAGCWVYAIAVVLVRLRQLIQRRESIDGGLHGS
jgi:heme exporter protein C